MSAGQRKNSRNILKKLKGVLTQSIDVNILNISIDGASVESNRSLSLNKPYYLQLPVDKGTLRIEAEVVWSKLAGLKKTDGSEILPIYRAGLRFKNILSEKAMELIDIIKKNKRLTIEQRVFGRFEISTDGATLLVPKEFTVEEMDLNTMVVLTAEELNVGQVYEMYIQADRERFIQCKGRVVDIEKRQDQYRARIEFLGLSETTRQELERFIKTLDSSA